MIDSRSPLDRKPADGQRRRNQPTPAVLLADQPVDLSQTDNLPVELTW